MYECNSIIKSATITNKDHGCLSAWIYIDYGGAGQGFGGYALYLPGDFSHSANQHNIAGHFIWRVMQIAGVTSWEDLKGKTIRVRTDEKHTAPIRAIGHIVADDWFYPNEEFKRLRDT